MPQPLLNGEVVQHDDDRDDRIAELEQENRKLRADLLRAKTETSTARLESQSAVAAITALRQSLGGLYRALRGVFGEIELVLGEETAVPAYNSSVPQASVDGRLHSLDKWEGVKKRLGGREAELIDVLLTSGPRTNTQLKPLMKMAYSSVCALTLKMSNMGFITKQGDAYALKE